MSATPSAVKAYDGIVIGGGHNGLVCAAYLARRGQSVLVLEAAQRVGGAAATREFAPGFSVSACAHLLHLMPRRIIADLALNQHGLRLTQAALPTVALSDSGAPLEMAAGSSALTSQLDRFARMLHPLFGQTPPRLGTSAWADRLALLLVGLRMRHLGRRHMRELLRVVGMNVYDWLTEHTQDPLLQGALGLDAVLGTNWGPRSPGTMLTLLYRLAGEVGARGGSPGQPVGGLGALSDALARAAAASGATIRTGARVERIRVRNDMAVGVVLESGEEIDARAVISSADPQTTFLRLLGTEHLDAGFVRRVAHLRTRGLTAKLHLALDRLPVFTGLDAALAAGRVLIAPSLDYIERAYNHAKYGEFSAAPILEITVPTINDPGLAPRGGHVLSAVVQYAPYALAGGWDAQRQRFRDLLIETIEAHAPGIKRSITASELLTPADIEREFGIAGGHWHHAELAFDQLYMVRPVPGAAQYQTPLTGLYLCGAGCHPGGGVMGAAGRNAARQVLKRAA